MNRKGLSSWLTVILIILAFLVAAWIIAGFLLRAAGGGFSGNFWAVILIIILGLIFVLRLTSKKYRLNKVYRLFNLFYVFIFFFAFLILIKLIGKLFDYSALSVILSLIAAFVVTEILRRLNKKKT